MLTAKTAYQIRMAVLDKVRNATYQTTPYALLSRPTKEAYARAAKAVNAKKSLKEIYKAYWPAGSPCETWDDRGCPEPFRSEWRAVIAAWRKAARA